MICKAKDIIKADRALGRLLHENFPGRRAYVIARLLKAIQDEGQSIQDARMAILQKYGDKDSNGNLIMDDNGNVQISPEHYHQCDSELNDLLSMDIDINSNGIPVSWLESITCTPEDTISLLPFIDENN